MRMKFALQSGFLGQEGIDPIAGDHHLAVNVALLAAHSHPDNAAIVPQHVVHHRRSQQQCTRCFGLRRQPAIKFGPQHGKAVIRRRGVTLARTTEIQRHRRGRRHKGNVAAGDIAFDRGLLPPVGNQFIENGAAVKHCAGHIFRAGIFAAFQQQHLEASAGA